LSQGSADVLALLAEVTQEQEAATTMEAAHITVVLAVETSAQEAAAAWDNATLHAKDAKDQGTLAEREALERVSRVEVENVMALACAREDAEGFVRKIAIPEGELAVEHWA
jgi:hypothetical protein